jgi:uncharacterized OB-fold protein
MGIKELLNLSDAEVQKPMPKPSKWSRPFWEAAKQHKLVLKRCKDCGHIDHPPYLYCTNCLSDNSEWIEAKGKAKLYAYAINEYMVPFPFWDDMPYVVAMVDLPEGVRMISNIIECPHDQLKNGMDLEVVFDDVSAEFTLPKWRPAKK